ncbi:MAG: hypothetical protein U9Q82_16315, partial [Chloroflexota bacterium]|nr:hypothetical protein [Chloroflexota bacterium]
TVTFKGILLRKTRWLSRQFRVYIDFVGDCHLTYKFFISYLFTTSIIYYDLRTIKENAGLLCMPCSARLRRGKLV